MSQIERIGDLEINQDLPHAQLEWKIERVGWVVMALVLLATLAGLLGPGPLSSAAVGERGSLLQVEYERLCRYHAPATLRANLGPGSTRDGKARVWLSREYVESIELIHIDPEPESVEVTHDRMIYTFNLSDIKDGTAVTYHFEAQRFGRVPVSIGLEGGPAIHFTQFFYP